MPVDFGKILKSSKPEKTVNPIEIYQGLDRNSEVGPLRPSQKAILETWFNTKREEKDLIIKSHTGQGKTLIGLLILQSKLNEGKGPALYVCPNLYLVTQTAEQADRFGIKYCLFEDGADLPEDFVSSKSILITHVQKVFNGMTKFGLGAKSTPVGTIILDDSHACIDSIKDSFTVKIKRKDDLYTKLLDLFEEDLKSQGEGSYLELRNGEYSTLMPVPYWAWKAKSSAILKLLLEYKDTILPLKFCWGFIRDHIDNCQCFISGHSLEISMYINPIWEIRSFYNAQHRILMSATTLDDSYFIRGLGLSVNAVKNPVVYEEEKWSGEKMIIIPSLIDHELNRDAVITTFANIKLNRFGIVIITTSYKKGEDFEKAGATLLKRADIFDGVKKLKKREFDLPIVLVNRYDGIDLPDEVCRILILDSKPFSEDLSDRYEESCRDSSDIINIKVAQKIEQGLGRSVRGEKDYSAIILIGTDLVNFIRSSKTQKYFSSQTKKQIEIGMQIAELASEEVTTDKYSMQIVIDLINQSIHRNDQWKAFYVDEMNSISNELKESTIYQILECERKAEEKKYEGDINSACDFIQKVINLFPDNKSEKGWYQQVLARYKGIESKVDSNTIQQSAFRNNRELLSPSEGFAYEKIRYISQSRLERIKNQFKEFESNSDFFLFIEDILAKLSFSEESDHFENALKVIGELLGFLSQRPDKEFKKGPDNLWCIGPNEYILFECKNEVGESRSEITKTEAAQLNTSVAWFKQEYPDAKCKNLMVIRTKTLDYHGTFGYEVEIMRAEKLNLFKSNLKSFFLEFKKLELRELTDGWLNTLIVTHKLDPDSIKKIYSEPYVERKSGKK